MPRSSFLLTPAWRVVRAERLRGAIENVQVTVVFA